VESAKKAGLRVVVVGLREWADPALAELADDYATAASQWAIPPTEAVGLVEQAIGDAADRTDQSPG